METVDVSNWQSQLKKGLLDTVILNLLGRGRCHGYDIARTLKGIDGLSIHEGNIYPILARLEADGLLASTRQPSAGRSASKVLRDNRTWPQDGRGNEPALGSDERKRPADQEGDRAMNTNDKTWESTKSNYLQQVERVLTAAKYPSGKSIIEEVRLHLGAALCGASCGAAQLGGFPASDHGDGAAVGLCRSAGRGQIEAADHHLAENRRGGPGHPRASGLRHVPGHYPARCLILGPGLM